ncbi:MAG: hypothetical protein V1723_00285 [Candidatus Uhrbacteria bacterium]
MTNKCSNGGLITDPSFVAKEYFGGGADGDGRDLYGMADFQPPFRNRDQPLSRVTALDVLLAIEECGLPKVEEVEPIPLAAMSEMSPDEWDALLEQRPELTVCYGYDGDDDEDVNCDDLDGGPIYIGSRRNALTQHGLGGAFENRDLRSCRCGRHNSWKQQRLTRYRRLGAPRSIFTGELVTAPTPVQPTTMLGHA